ncbi:hypothetical protein FISHEDRAFT_55756 [Fistulina hepatica ATCC 64428]|uniref:Uncharacterized protein n=1 Tax=Fistulina hepatica ATCC 64428 TaxID=1128425 RepID=A0A0D7APS7_9AGAR|nr:hypothetical protein FISHEDRAFT_55756 [Fistulina hepatica ATCC 64428]
MPRTLRKIFSPFRRERRTVGDPHTSFSSVKDRQAHDHPPGPEPATADEIETASDPRIATNELGLTQLPVDPVVPNATPALEAMDATPESTAVNDIPQVKRTKSSDTLRGTFGLILKALLSISHLAVDAADAMLDNPVALTELNRLDDALGNVAAKLSNVSADEKPSASSDPLCVQKATLIQVPSASLRSLVVHEPIPLSQFFTLMSIRREPLEKLVVNVLSDSTSVPPSPSLSVSFPRLTCLNITSDSIVGIKLVLMHMLCDNRAPSLTHLIIVCSDEKCCCTIFADDLTRLGWPASMREYTFCGPTQSPDALQKVYEMVKQAHSQRVVSFAHEYHCSEMTARWIIHS